MFENILMYLNKNFYEEITFFEKFFINKDGEILYKEMTNSWKYFYKQGWRENLFKRENKTMIKLIYL